MYVWVYRGRITSGKFPRAMGSTLNHLPNLFYLILGNSMYFFHSYKYTTKIVKPA